MGSEQRMKETYFSNKNKASATCVVIAMVMLLHVFNRTARTLPLLWVQLPVKWCVCVFSGFSYRAPPGEHAGLQGLAQWMESGFSHTVVAFSGLLRLVLQQDLSCLAWLLTVSATDGWRLDDLILGAQPPITGNSFINALIARLTLKAHRSFLFRVNRWSRSLPLL